VSHLPSKTNTREGPRRKKAGIERGEKERILEAQEWIAKLAGMLKRI
jgi:hypothetical protein